MIYDTISRLAGYWAEMPFRKKPTTEPLAPAKPTPKAGRRRKLKAKGCAYRGPARLDADRPILGQMRSNG
ncbi:hypothetical protein [Methylogaea oryzae]|uniref:Uncharacterized protein n=1 Tax=Methylogaea oryzae TaxID=1295382 RepID=A0A8D4VPP7_9GAMM|nr:hypothetical protein [Methylogaea oryzae]BBL72143.1 hypothetical protein MoryE10_27490 [Methylogaea oryzae]